MVSRNLKIHKFVSYINKDKSVKQIIQETNCEEGYIYQQLQKFNIAKLNKFDFILTKEFLQEHLDIIKIAERSNEPLGTHIEYQQFPTRQRILQTLNKNLNKVKLVDGSYHDRPMLDRFTEWCSHKSHWVVPVLNDVPIRVFDSLITGGIPIIPRSLKYHKDIINLSDDILFYDYADIQNPHEITKKANNLFDERGIQGVLDRHYKVLYNYHVDSRVESILKAIHDEYGIPGLV